MIQDSINNFVHSPSCETKKKKKQRKKDEAKAMKEHISCDCKYKFISATCNSKQKWSNKTCHYECKNYRKCKENYNWNPSKCICENSKYLKSIANTKVTECDEIIIVMDTV